MGDAEEALAALARDLVEEISAGRAVELAADETLELATFHVRGFPRMQRTRTGRVIPEEVRQHMATKSDLPHPGNLSELGSRFVQGAPGHDVRGITQPQWQGGQKEFEAKGRAAWDARRAKRVGKLASDITATRGLLSSGPDKDADQHPGTALFHQHAFSTEGKHASAHLDEAARRLGEHVRDTGKVDQNALADAYHHLHLAHQAGVDQALSRAHAPEEKQDVRATLDRIQEHMEKLDEVAGVKPQMTRRLLGSSGDQGRRASDFQDAAKSEATRHAENGNEAGVARHVKSGLIHPDDARQLTDQAGQVALQKEQAAMPMPRGPQPRTGAAAIYPQAAQHTARLPGGTLSGHEFMHRAIPTGQLPTPSPEARALDRAHARVQHYADQAARNRASDLRDHLAAMKAAESERAGLAAPGTYQPLTDDEYALHAAHVDQAVREALLKGLATSAQHSPDGGYLWSPQRALEHSAILSDFLARQTDVPSGKQAIMLGGLGGAGKSTTLKQVPDISLKDYVVINPDHFKKELAVRGLVPEVAGLSPLEASPLVHDESSYLADQAAALLHQRGKNLAYDVTMSSEDHTRKRLDQLARWGYQVHAVFVDTPVEEAAKRADSRYRQRMEAYRAGKDPLGGRHVPPDIIRSQEVSPGVTRNRQAFEALKPKFASWQLWDNSGNKPKLTSRGGTASPGTVPSIEQLRREYLGNTESTARAAETGALGKEEAT